MRTFLLTFMAAALLFGLDVTFHVQETTNNPVTDYPVTFCMPLPAWTYGDVASFRITDAGGTTVPAQISVLNKHWQSGYIRHVLVTLKTSLTANEKKAFHFRDDGAQPVTGGLSINETAADITVNTGPLQFKIKKQNFNLFDEVYVDLNSNSAFEANEQIIVPSADNGGIFTNRNSQIQKSSDVANPMFEVEEAGPIRAIIRVEAPTIFTSTSNMTHGYMVRIYAYAGKSFVKVEYTLKNSAFNAEYSWPLYCKDFSVRTRLNLDSPTVTIGKETDVHSQALGNGIYVYQDQYDSYDIKSSSGSIIIIVEARQI